MSESPKPRKRWFNFGPRMTAARWLVILVGVFLPYVMRIPGMVVHGFGWFTSYGPTEWDSILLIGTYNSICWGSILLTTLTFRHPRSVWFPAILGFTVPAFAHATLDLASDAQASIALIFIPIYSLPLVIVGWLLGFVFDRFVFKETEASPQSDQFTLRSLLVVITAVAIVLGLFAAEWRRSDEKVREAMRQAILERQMDPELARDVLGNEVDSLKATLREQDADQPPLALTRSMIESVAVAEVIKRTSLQPDQLEESAEQRDDEWHVIVWRLPKTPGGHYFLRMSKAGEVKEFINGE